MEEVLEGVWSLSAWLFLGSSDCRSCRNALQWCPGAVVGAGCRCQAREKQCLAVGHEPAELLDPPGLSCLLPLTVLRGHFSPGLQSSSLALGEPWGAAGPVKSPAGDTGVWIARYLGGTPGHSVLVWWLLLQDTLRVSDFCIYLLL